MKRLGIIMLSVTWLLLAAWPAGAQTEYFIHTVRWYEGIKDIAKKYDVPVEVIMEVNNLEKPKVKSKMKLKIPVDLQAYYRMRAEAETEAKSETETPEGTVAPADSTDSAAADIALLPSRPAREEVYATLVLPLGQTESSDNAFDFYSGAMLAARDLAEQGVRAEINVINLTGDEVSEDAAAKIVKSDLIIGPVAEGDLVKMLAATSTIPVVSPLDPRAAGLADSVANFVQAPTAATRQYTDLAEWLAEDREPTDNVVLVSETGVVLSAGMQEFERVLEEKGIESNKLSYNILEGRDIASKVEAAMVPEITNRVVVLSENEAFVNDVVRNLNLMLYNKFDVVLYSSSRIRGFETIDIENLHSLNLHVCSTYFIDYEDSRVNSFVLAYRALFGAEPSQFSFQGYDVMGYFIKACHDSGNEWPNNLARIRRAKMLQADFKFSKQPGGGYLNTGVRRIIYTPDYSVKEILH